jgi:hypothetical protein
MRLLDETELSRDEIESIRSYLEEKDPSKGRNP